MGQARGISSSHETVQCFWSVGASFFIIFFRFRSFYMGIRLESPSREILRLEAERVGRQRLVGSKFYGLNELQLRAARPTRASVTRTWVGFLSAPEAGRQEHR